MTRKFYGWGICKSHLPVQHDGHSVRHLHFILLMCEGGCCCSKLGHFEEPRLDNTTFPKKWRHTPNAQKSRQTGPNSNQISAIHSEKNPSSGCSSWLKLTWLKPFLHLDQLVVSSATRHSSQHTSAGRWGSPPARTVRAGSCWTPQLRRPTRQLKDANNRPASIDQA